jgi:PAS domain S-box-containing protein
MTAAIAISLVASVLYFVLFGFSLRVKRRMNRIFSAYLLTMGLWTTTSVMWFADFPALSDVPWLQAGMFFVIIAWMLMWLLSMVILGLDSQPAIRAALAVVAGLGLLLLVADVAGQLLHVTRIERGHYDVQFEGLIYLFFALAGISGIVLTIMFARARARTDDHNQRRRLVYFAISNVLLVVGGLSNLSTELRPIPTDILFDVMAALVMAYAIYRYRLLDLTFVVRQGLLYSIPTVIVGTAYFLIVYLTVSLFHLVTGYQVLLLSLGMAAVTALAFQPLRDKLQSWIDKFFFREKYDSSLMLQKLSQMAASVLDLDKLTSMILDEVTTVMHISKAALFLKRERGGLYRRMAQRGIDLDVDLKLAEGHPIVQWLSRHKQSLTRRQVNVGSVFKGMWDEEREDLDRIEAELFVPLLVRDDLIGILVLGPKLSEAPYSTDEQLTLTTLANQTAVAIENARLFFHEQRKATESAALLDIAHAIGSVLDLNRLLKIVARKAAGVCQVDRCSILLLDSSGRKLTPLMSQYADGSIDERLWRLFKKETYIETVDSVPLVRQVVRGRRPVILYEGSAALVPSSWIKPFGIASMLAVPLISQDQVIGLMVLDHIEPGRRFGDEQVNLATTIGSQVAIAIENARLWQETLEEKERTQTILDQAFAGFMVVDSQLKVVALNPAAQSIIGYSAQEALGRLLPEICRTDGLREGGFLHRALRENQRVLPVEVPITVEQGARDLLLAVTPLRDGHLVSFADISRLKEVDRLKSNIVANVSHELRTPLASIKAYTEILLDNLEGPEPARRHRFLAVIDEETDRLSELVTDLLDLSRLESGRFEVDRQPLSIAEVINGVVAVLGVQAQKSDVTINVDVPADLPLLPGDPELVRILMRNLLSNAIKFNRPGGRVDVTVREDEDDGVLELRVADEGIGIPAKDMPHLFEKFFRTWSAREAGIRGTGLGLVLAKQAVEAHDGTIEVESTEGVGTCVTVTFPTGVRALLPLPEQGTESARRSENSVTFRPS